MSVRLEVACASFNELEHDRMIGCHFSATDRPADVLFELKRHPHPSDPNTRRDRRCAVPLTRWDQAAMRHAGGQPRPVHAAAGPRQGLGDLGLGIGASCRGKTA